MIIDDHEVVRRGLTNVVDAAEGLSVVGEAGSVAEAIRRLALVDAQVLLVDLQLPDGNGIEIITAAADLPDPPPSVVLTSFDDDDAVAAALSAGAKAFVLKTVRGAEIAEVIRSVAAGRTLLDQRTVASRRRGATDPMQMLTKSEVRIVELIGEGLANREIAQRVGVAEKTVKNHITAILAKLGLQRRTQVAAWVASRRSSQWRGGEAT
ncbi:MAG TPA: response regulator transcription factor [Beutenbergiaceae bacterium]|nr:response regulator transcription factor [Beutenbergiaceae bacterium]